MNTLEATAIVIHRGDIFLSRVIENYYKLVGRKTSYNEDSLDYALRAGPIYFQCDQETVTFSLYTLNVGLNFRILFAWQNMNQIHDLFHADYKARHESQKPRINGYELDYINQEDNIVGFGGTKISISFLRSIYDTCGTYLNSNRTLKGITLDSGVQLTREQIREILDYYDNRNLNNW